MISVNDITGDLIRTKRSNDAYRDGWSKIFGDQSKKIDIIPLEEFNKSVETGKTPPHHTAPYFKCIELASDGSSALDGYYVFIDDQAAQAYIKKLELTSNRLGDAVAKLELVYEGVFPISAINFSALKASPMGFLCFTSIKKAAL